VVDGTDSSTDSHFEFKSANHYTTEHGGSVELMVKREGPRGTASVDYSLIDWTAKPGMDYTPVSGTLTFQPGQMEQIITVPIVDNILFEQQEKFLVMLSNPSSGGYLDAQWMTSVNITDNDTLKLEIGPGLHLSPQFASPDDSIKQAGSSPSRYREERSRVWDEPVWETQNEHELLDLLGPAVFKNSKTRLHDSRPSTVREAAEPGSELWICEDELAVTDDDLLEVSDPSSQLPIVMLLRGIEAETGAVHERDC
jgi:hypothetical protein